MSNFASIPRPTQDQKKSMEIGFMRSFGKSYNKMKKAELALMVINASNNYKKAYTAGVKVVQIGLAMKRQRNWYHKLIRINNSKTLD